MTCHQLLSPSGTKLKVRIATLSATCNDSVLCACIYIKKQNCMSTTAPQKSLTPPLLVLHLLDFVQQSILPQPRLLPCHYFLFVFCSFFEFFFHKFPDLVRKKCSGIQDLCFSPFWSPFEHGLRCVYHHS